MNLGEFRHRWAFANSAAAWRFQPIGRWWPLTVRWQPTTHTDCSSMGSKQGRAAASRAKLFEVGRWLRPGANTLSVRVQNVGDAPNPAGLLAVLHVDFETGPPLRIMTDATWYARAPDSSSEQDLEARSGPSDAATPAHPRTEDGQGAGNEGWTTAEELGARGCAPWGHTLYDDSALISRYAFSRLTFALAALYLHGREPAADMRRANAAVLDAVERIRRGNRSLGEFGMHWMGAVFYRIYALFGPHGQRERILSPEGAAAIERLFADWAKTQSRMADASPADTWQIWGSENHSASGMQLPGPQPKCSVTHRQRPTFATKTARRRKSN